MDKGNGYELQYHRRRYGTVTYTWVYAVIDGDLVQLGDPWPAVVPKKSEVAAAVAEAVAQRKGA